MLLTFDSLRVHVGGAIGTDWTTIDRLLFRIDPNAATVKGQAVLAGDKATEERTFPIHEQLDQVKALARKFYTIRRPKAVAAASVVIDYTTRTADVSIFYTSQADAKLKHVERHEF